MFCPNCGTQLSDDASFCHMCGTPVSKPEIGAGQPAAPEPVAAPEPAPVAAPVAPVAPEQPAYQQPSYEPAAYQQPSYQQQPYDPAAYQQQQYQQAYQPQYQQPVYQQPAPQAAPSQGFKIPSIGELFSGYDKNMVAYAEQTGIQMKWYKALTAALLYITSAYNLYAAFQYLTGTIYGSSSSSIYSHFPALRVIDIIYGIFVIAFVLFILYIRMRLARFCADGPKLYLAMIIINVVSGIVYGLIGFAIIGAADYGTLSGTVVGALVMFVLNRTYFQKRQHLFTA